MDHVHTADQGFLILQTALCKIKSKINKGIFVLQNLPTRVIGHRVRAAREQLRLTQEQLTTQLDINDRQTLSDIENGKRSVRPDELVLFAKALAKPVTYFIDPFSLHGEAAFSWRAAPEIEESCLEEFEDRAGLWVGLFRWLSSKSANERNPLKITLRLGIDSSFEDARAQAESLAKHLELGDIPANRLIEAAETKLDIPIIFVDTIEAQPGKTISGATCHLDDFCAILINRHEAEGRRFYDIAHELFHALTWDKMPPEHRESPSGLEKYPTKSRIKRIESLADNFAAALLMPQYSLEKIIDRSKLTDQTYLISIVSTYQVTPSALAWRLYNLKWISKDVADALRAQKRRKGPPPKRFSLTYAKLLHEGISQGRLSARKAAKTLGMDLTEFSALFAEHSLSAPFEL